MYVSLKRNSFCVVQTYFCDRSISKTTNNFPPIKLFTLKPGVCPRRRPRPGLCAELCANDGDCPRNQKCCSTGCGHQCTSPHTTVKPGVCPRRRPRPGLCAELCANDGDCPRNQKCCSNGCGHQCTSPHTTGNKEHCLKSCPAEQKCCPTTCGHACSEPG
ncbi:putative WAP four-disulfide core domain protein 3-like [Triplophysa rosa]|uniref:WAP four-disulfide core domain protein 3-like n=1 Tax=Triplophysa rosa TaxID=992332 RepID=A0A9W7W9L2_TRIRA|nr:putative WAP four-disulfide core domain protein 3-like [Triplophysa rosa]